MCSLWRWYICCYSTNSTIYIEKIIFLPWLDVSRTWKTYGNWSENLGTGLVKLLIGRNPSLYSCQSFLPTLPLPSLDDTLKRYLRTVRPLYNDTEYHRMELLAEEFRQTIGRKLQRYLWLKWLISTNYVNQLFEFCFFSNLLFGI